MAVAAKPDRKSLIVDKEELIRLLEEIDRQTGFVPDRTVTTEQLRAMTVADGVRPEDCIASREIIRMREE